MLRYLSILLFCCAGFISAQTTDGYHVVGQPVKLVDSEQTGFTAMRPSYSPDSKLLAFTTDHNRGIHVLDLDAGGIKTVTDADDAGFGFQWNASSSQLLARVAKSQGFYRYHAIKLFDVATGQESQLSTYHTAMTGLPRFVQGGAAVAVMERSGPKLYDTRLNLAKTGAAESVMLKNGVPVKVNLTENTTIKLAEQHEGPCLNLVTSPDGNYAAYEVLGGNLMLLNLKSGEETDLGRAHRPQWSPDSEFLVCMVTEDDGHQYLSADLVIISIETGKHQELMPGSKAFEMNPCWSPDGRYIAYDVSEDGSIYQIEISR